VSSKREAIVYGELDPSKGKLASLIDSYGHVNVTDPNNGQGTVTVPSNITVEGYYPKMLSDLERLSSTFIEVFNTVHKAGHPLDYAGLTDLNSDGTVDADDFKEFNVFEIVDGKVKVNQSIVDNPSLLAASSVENEEGNGKWAIEIANLQYI
ncbi:hypothetical protein RhiirA1_487071, partial [Rhizophagus irregularis]